MNMNKIPNIMGKTVVYCFAKNSNNKTIVAINDAINDMFTAIWRGDVVFIMALFGIKVCVQNEVY